MFATDGIYPKSHLLEAGDLKLFCGIEMPHFKDGSFMVDMHELSKDDEALLIHLGVNGVECCKRCVVIAIARLTKRAPDGAKAARKNSSISGKRSANSPRR